MKSDHLPRYQDYVIKDGRHVGEFEAMYQDFDDPWEQTRMWTSPELDRYVGLDLLRKYGHKRALEYGCGLGHYTNFLHSGLEAAAGVDISETAIAKAREMYPGPSFFVGDILEKEPLLDFHPDVLVFSQITWYVLDKLASFKDQLQKQNARGFLHLLQIYPEGGQSYGREFFEDLDGILEYWSDVIEYREWGLVCRREDDGSGRTFFYGEVK